jgi:MoxR-like ATPase
MSNRDAILELRRRMADTLVGQDHALDALLTALLVGGHVLTEMRPAHPRAMRALYPHLEAGFMRIQFTSDLLPSDLTGYYWPGPEEGKAHFTLGPLHANLILADDINLAPPETQAALLEAMETRVIRVESTSQPLPDLFLVQANENNFASGETVPLTASQRDCFLVKVVVPWPNEEALLKMCQLAREESAGKVTWQPRISQQTILAARAEVQGVPLDEAAQRCVAALPQYGAGPRGALALAHCARARAWLAGSDRATPDDVRAVAPDCLRHRIDAAGVEVDQVIAELVERVAVS